jgi:AraC-like DNA-binding protein
MVAISRQTSLTDQDAGFDVVHADTLRYFPELVRELGGDPESLARDIGVDPCCLSSGPVGYRSIARLMEHAAIRLRCTDFGLRLAKRQGGGSVFGALGVVMRHAKTVGAGLQYVAEHSHAHSLAARVRIEPERSKRNVLVGHDILVDRLPIKRQLIEQLLLLAHLNAVEISGGKARVREARFRFQPLSSIATYRRYFGCDVRFEEAGDGVVFSEADLACSTVDPDRQLFAKATSFIEQRFSRLQPPMRARVRAQILQCIETSDCSKERVAAALCLHPRTLHRRLNDEGTCFEEIKDGVRRDIAIGYLRATKLSIQRIAEKVGYAEHSVLTRSCSRWFAASPREIRRHAPNEVFDSRSEREAQVVPKCRVS